jgi:hypothetical protein
MPISSNYYLNSSTLSTATAIFDDAGLTICAADGYYSDGTIVRQQIGCVLASETVCSCLIPYNSSIEPFPNSEGVCGQEMPIAYYTNSVTPFLIIGDLVYQDSIGATPLNDGWYITPTEIPECPLAYEVLAGVIINTFNCCS